MAESVEVSIDVEAPPIRISRVTERWDDKRGGLIKFLGRAATGIAERDEHNAQGMRETLARIKEEAEAG